MSHENGETKIKLSTHDYAELSTDCSLVAGLIGLFPFVTGGIGVPIALKYLDRIFYTSVEIKALGGIFAAVGLGLYSCKISMERCERKITDKYIIP